MIDVSAYIRSKFPSREPNSAGEIHGTCPFHDDRTKSFSINTSTGVFVCGSTKCGVRGNFFLFYKIMENLDSWKTVYEQLSKPSLATNINKLLNVTKKKKDLTHVINDFPDSQFLQEINTIDYLEDRGITKRVCDMFGLKYGMGGEFDEVNISNTIVIPIFDTDGTYRTFQARALTDTGLRWNTPIHSPIQYLLYGGWLTPPRGGYIGVVEGASDVWNLASHNFYSVGIFTSKASKPQLMKIVGLCKISNSVPVVMLDGDACVPRKPKNTIDAKKLFNELYALDLKPIWLRLAKDEDPGGMSEARVNELKLKLECGHENQGSVA